ncbi:MAG TPA: GNAT family protein [Flavobacteriales bacterium]|nr:GNAT family protein [Flavobacteriales bacterium]HRJ39565.1 GNAT family protein [Flavobacteriales bacterium]
MQELTFKILDKAKITTDIANSFIELLVKQGKVDKPTVDRIKSCRQLSLCYADSKLIGIGAIKPKTKSDFATTKADLMNIEQQFVWELGYFFIDDNYRGYGISTTIARLLLKGKDKENILASTELYPDNVMIKVLEKFGFRQYGKPWLSKRHDGTLGLFLKFKVGETIDNKPTTKK